MSRSTTITVRVDPEAKEQAERIYQMFGMTVSDAINLLFHKTVMENGLPFDLKISNGEVMVDSMSSTQPNVDELRKLVKPIAEKAGVNKLILFGSRARGDFDEDSDYDFCVEMKDGSNLLTVVHFMDDLEKIVKAKVDLIEAEGASDRILNAVKEEGIMIYEQQNHQRTRQDYRTL